MGAAISKSNRDYINNNWDQLKCSPLGPFLQMLGVAPGNVKDTTNTCRSAEFSSMFNSSISEQLNITNNLTSGLNIVTDTLNKFRTVIASMEQRAFEDLSMIATQIFKIYVKIGNLFQLMMKHLINIMSIFKNSVNFGAAITKLLFAFINLLRVPINGLIDFVNIFRRI